MSGKKKKKAKKPEIGEVRTPKKRGVRGPTDKRYAFLAAFAQCGNIRQACEVADYSKSTVHALIVTDAEFKKLFDEAKDDAIERLEQEARRRAEQGVQRLKFTKSGELICIPDPSGRMVTKTKRVKIGKKWVDQEVTVPLMVPYVEHVYSDTLAIFLLKSLRPEVYNDYLKVAGRMENLNANLNLGTGNKQLMNREELLVESKRLIAELEEEKGTIDVERNGHSNNGSQNGESE